MFLDEDLKAGEQRALLWKDGRVHSMMTRRQNRNPGQYRDTDRSVEIRGVFGYLKEPAGVRSILDSCYEQRHPTLASELTAEDRWFKEYWPRSPNKQPTTLRERMRKIGGLKF